MRSSQRMNIVGQRPAPSGISALAGLESTRAGGAS
jgi:hypothetical protein